MIAMLTGTVIRAGATDFILDVGGVGYRAHTTAATASELRLGESLTIHTSLVVREDSLTLYGFSREVERDTFELVQAASGVGPRIAAAMISVLSPDEIRRAVLQEDLATLTKVPGIGRKGAQKIIIELKDKVLVLPDGGQAADDPATPAAATRLKWREQVAEGLQGLGWSARDAASACDNIAHLVDEDPDIKVGSLMRAALGSLARK